MEVHIINNNPLSPPSPKRKIKKNLKKTFPKSLTLEGWLLFSNICCTFLNNFCSFYTVYYFLLQLVLQLMFFISILVSSSLLICYTFIVCNTISAQNMCYICSCSRFLLHFLRLLFTDVSSLFYAQNKFYLFCILFFSGTFNCIYLRY